tara:strand:+ start:67 stop:441 length:375 start_codon:yes stop_codon:yes gene_type:complete
MKTFKELREVLTIQQRKLKSRIAKRKAKITARKRKKSMMRPPTPDKIEKAINKAVRKKAIDMVDKGGKYNDPDASIGIKTNIEKKADIKTQKMGAKWKKRLKPIIKKKMKDDFKRRKLAAKEKE